MKKPAIEVTPESSLYDSDFVEWTQAVAAGLRKGRVPAEDLEHIAEEIEDMGKGDRREVESRLAVLIMHLMKWAAQRERRPSRSWLATINEQRSQLFLILRDSPSLRRYLIREIPAIYNRAARGA